VQRSVAKPVTLVSCSSTRRPIANTGAIQPARYKARIGRTGERATATGHLNAEARAPRQVFYERRSNLVPATTLKLDNIVKRGHLRSSTVFEVLIEDLGWTLDCWHNRAGQQDLPGLGE
jgi:hypothetical protein